MSDMLPLAEEVRAAEARARITASLGELQVRLAPRTLAQTAVQGLADKGQAAARSGITVAKQNPAAVSGAIAAFGLFLARKPIARLFARTPVAAPKPSTRASKRNAE